MPSGPILVVEDDALLSSMVREILEIEGYEVLSAPHGQAALKIVGTRHPGLILLDLNTPILDGRHFLEAYRHLPFPRVPVIVVSGLPFVAEEAETLGANDYLEKPFTLEQLRLLVRRHLS